MWMRREAGVSVQLALDQYSSLSRARFLSRSSARHHALLNYSHLGWSLLISITLDDFRIKAEVYQSLIESAGRGLCALES